MKISQYKPQSRNYFLRTSVQDRERDRSYTRIEGNRCVSEQRKQCIYIYTLYIGPTWAYSHGIIHTDTSIKSNENVARVVHEIEARNSCLHIRNPAVNRRGELAGCSSSRFAASTLSESSHARERASEQAAGPAVNHNYHRVRFYSNGNSLGSLGAL